MASPPKLLWYSLSTDFISHNHTNCPQVTVFKFKKWEECQGTCIYSDGQDCKHTMYIQNAIIECISRGTIQYRKLCKR